MIRVTERQETAEGRDGDAGRTGRCHRAQSGEMRSCPSGRTSVIQGERGQGHTRPGAVGWRVDPIPGSWIEALSRASREQLYGLQSGVLEEQSGSGGATDVPVGWTWTQLTTPPNRNLQECEEPGHAGAWRGSGSVGDVPVSPLLWKEP